MNRNLSPHFLESEFTCNCGCKTTFVDSRLLKGLEELRVLVNKPIKILSGYRCIKNNAEAGGGKNSQHLYGKAVDLVIKDFSVAQMYEAALQIPEFFDGGIGIYPAGAGNFIKVKKFCDLDGCGKKFFALGRCKNHYNQLPHQKIKRRKACSTK
jgi:hypothetical protein